VGFLRFFCNQVYTKDSSFRSEWLFYYRIRAGGEAARLSYN